jgi:hypothetical protein
MEGSKHSRRKSQSDRVILTSRSTRRWLLSLARDRAQEGRELTVLGRGHHAKRLLEALAQALPRGYFLGRFRDGTDWIGVMTTKRDGPWAYLPPSQWSDESPVPSDGDAL